MLISKFQKVTPSRLVQRRLQISLILTLLAVTSVIIVTALLKAAYVRHEAFSVLIAQTTGQARTTLLEFFKPVASNLRLLRRWGMNSDLSNLNAEIMARQFIPVMEEFPQLWAAILADEAGREFFVYRDGDEWLVRTVDAGRRPGEADWERWQGSASATETWSDKLTYDPRARPWFRGATAAEYFDKVFWTPPYTFASAQEPGVTAAISFSDAQEPPKTYVLAFDILMTQVMDFMDAIPVSEHGKAFLFNGQGSLFGSETSNSDNTPLTAAIGEALARWRANPELRDKVSEFNSGAQIFWAGFQPVALEEGEVWIGVVVPQRDMQQEIASRQYWLWSMAGIALLIGAMLATWIARYFGRQLRSLERRQLPQGNTEEEIKALIAHGESERLEFKSTLRFNLKAGRTGKEIELAWLKGVVAFLNTEGGTVIIGVADDGAVVGLEHDDFDNEDKCLLHFNNLINHHIGQEFAQYLSAKISSFEGKRILLVDCEPSAEPAFLRAKQDEEFYVRTGPRNAKLPVSKALSYVQSRRRAH